MADLEQVHDALMEYGFSDFAAEIFYDDTYLPGIGQAKHVESFGGDGFCSDEMWVVFSIEDNFYRIKGTYSEWGGRDWEMGHDFNEVIPTPVTIIKYLSKPIEGITGS